MSAKDTVRGNKTAIQMTLSTDHKLILNKVFEKRLITPREYNNLKSINQVDVEGHVVELVDKIMNKGEETCQAFLDLLQTDEDIKSTCPELMDIPLNACLLRKPVQECSVDHGDPLPESKRRKEDDQYQINSQPAGLCVIINNEKFSSMSLRSGTNEDAPESLAEVFSWLGFRVLMFQDQTKDNMDRALDCFASLSDSCQPQDLGVKEWSGREFATLQEPPPKHGDAFICCILSHGVQGVVCGTDGESLCIKEITKNFGKTSALIGKPKVFLIQACQGAQKHLGALLPDLQTDDSSPSYIPAEADVLVAIATVEDYESYRLPGYGSWFIQSVCKQLKMDCPSGDDLTTILQRVNDEVSRKEASRVPGLSKQMPEVRFTLRKRLVLSPHRN